MRYLYISYIRIFAVIFVVFSHSFAPYDQWKWVQTSEDSFFSVVNVIISPFVAMMPLLTFLSGFLFAQLDNRYNTFLSLLTKKFKRLILPMIVFGILYFALFESTFNFTMATINTILSGYGVLWYCNMLFFSFLIAYPIRKYIENAYWKIAILFVLFGFIYVPIPMFLGMDMVAHLFFYFYFGILFFELFNRYKILRSKKVMIGAGLIFAISFIVYLLNIYSGVNSHILKVLSGNCLRISFLIFIFLLFHGLESKLTYSNTIRFLDQNSFGLYLFHFPIIYFIYNQNLFEYQTSSHIWTFPIMSFVFTTIATYFIAFYIRRTNVGIYLIG